MNPLYFNRAAWERIGLDTQSIRYLEELFERVGGATVPEYTLTETTNIIQNVEGEAGNPQQGNSIDVATMHAALHQLQHRADASTRHNAALTARVQNLEHRISQLESEARR